MNCYNTKTMLVLRSENSPQWTLTFLRCPLFWFCGLVRSWLFSGSRKPVAQDSFVQGSGDGFGVNMPESDFFGGVLDPRLVWVRCVGTWRDFVSLTATLYNLFNWFCGKKHQSSRMSFYDINREQSWIPGHLVKTVFSFGCFKGFSL